MNTKKYDKSRTMCQYGILNGTGKPVIMDTERRQFKWFLVPENVYAALIPAPVRLKPCVLLALSPAPYALRRSHGASSIQYRVSNIEHQNLNDPNHHNHQNDLNVLNLFISTYPATHPLQTISASADQDFRWLQCC